MNTLKLRRLLITLHLWIAGLLAPAFLIVAISGGLDMAGVEPSVRQTPLALPADTRLDFGSDEIEQHVRDLLDAQDVDIDFEYIRGSNSWAMTRPTTRTFVRFERGHQGNIEATINRPNLQYALMELHKGHGPRIYRLYQVAVALALFLAVIGGVAVGLLARNYRKQTLIATVFGTLLAAGLAIL